VKAYCQAELARRCVSDGIGGYTDPSRLTRQPFRLGQQAIAGGVSLKSGVALDDAVQVALDSASVQTAARGLPSRPLARSSPPALSPMQSPSQGAPPQRRTARFRAPALALLLSLLLSPAAGRSLSAQTIPDGVLVIPLKPGNLVQRGRDRLLYDGPRLELLFNPATNGDVYVVVRDLVSLTDLPRGVPATALEIGIDSRPTLRVSLQVVGRGESSRNEQSATVVDAYRGQLSDEDAAALLAASRLRGRVRGVSFESDPKASTPLLAGAKRREGQDVVAIVGPSGGSAAGGGMVGPSVGSAVPVGNLSGSLHGANIRIVRDFAYEAPDSISGRFVAVEEGVSNPVAGPACGTARLCASRWDLRPVSIDLPGTVLPAGGEVPVTVTVENRGATASELSEVQLCFTSYRGGPCQERIANVTLPPMPSASSVRITATAKPGPSESRGFHIAAIVDPDRVTNEENRENNAAATEALATELPALQWLQVEPVVLGEERKAVEITMRIRNKSVAASSLPVEVVVRTEVGTNCESGGGSPFRFQLPALGPRQVVNATLTVRDLTRALCSNASNVSLRVDPDRQLLWGNNHEESHLRRFEAIRR
jgi:hypothetical protein